MKDKEKICAFPGCGTILSRYREFSNYCSVHQIKMVDKNFAKKIVKIKKYPPGKWIQITNWFLKKSDLNFALEQFKGWPRGLVKIKEKMRCASSEWGDPMKKHYAVFRKGRIPQKVLDR